MKFSIAKEDIQRELIRLEGNKVAQEQLLLKIFTVNAKTIHNPFSWFAA